jgi:hypothetical protein
MSKKKTNEASRETDAFTISPKKKKFFFPFLICLLIAFALWLYASNAEADKNREKEESSDASVAADVGEWNEVICL